jgi:hypothetical protein
MAAQSADLLQGLTEPLWMRGNARCTAFVHHSLEHIAPVHSAPVHPTHLCTPAQDPHHALEGAPRPCASDTRPPPPPSRRPPKRRIEGVQLYTRVSLPTTFIAIAMHIMIAMVKDDLTIRALRRSGDGGLHWLRGVQWHAHT